MVVAFTTRVISKGTSVYGASSHTFKVTVFFRPRTPILISPTTPSRRYHSQGLWSTDIEHVVCE
jgi:hypothetical protein